MWSSLHSTVCTFLRLVTPTAQSSECLQFRLRLHSGFALQIEKRPVEEGKLKYGYSPILLVVFVAGWRERLFVDTADKALRLRHRSFSFFPRRSIVCGRVVNKRRGRLPMIYRLAQHPNSLPSIHPPIFILLSSSSDASDRIKTKARSQFAYIIITLSSLSSTRNVRAT